MESGSKAANLEFQLFDFNEVELMDNGHIMVEKYQQNETAGNFSKGIVEPPCGSSPPLINQPNSKHNLPASASASDHNNELLESPSENNGRNLAPSGTSPGIDPTFTEASQMPKTADDVEVELQSPLTRHDQPQLNQMNDNPDTFGRGNVSHDNSNPLHEQLSPGRTNESFLHHASSNPNLLQPTYSGFEGNDTSLGHDATDAQETTSPLFSPLIMEQTHSFPMALAEKIPQNGSYADQSFYSEHGVNSVQPNQLNGHIGSSLQAELLWPQREEPVNPGKTILFADQFEQNNGNNNFNDIQQALPYPNLFPQSPSGIGFLHGGSTQINQQAPTWVSNKENDLYRPLAPSGSQVNQFKAISNSDPQCYNFMLPRSSAPLMPQQLNNPLELLNQVPNTPNASDPLLQHSLLTKHSMPIQLMPQHFSYDQHNQVPTAPGAYNSQICSTRLPESSMPLRTPILPPHHQINPFDVSDLHYRNSVQSKAPMLSSGGFIFQDLSDHRHHQFNPANLITNLFGTQCSNSMLQESLMRSGSYQLPAHQQASSQFSMMPSLPNSELHNSKLTESSILPRLQTVQQQGLLNQTARPIATYPSSGTSLSSIGLNSLLQPEIGGTSASHQMETSLSSHKEKGISGRRRGHARSRFELGESSSFKRFRRESTMPQASSAEQMNRTFLSLQNEASTSSNTASLFYPRPIKNSVYDPIYEGIGLPIDPHLRLFATS